MDLLISSLSLGKAIELYKNELITAHNPRRLGRKNKKKLPSEVSKIRVKIEHTNSILKNRFMNKFWINIKGYIRKKVFCLCAVVSAQVLALYNLITKDYLYRGFLEVKV